MNEDEEAELVGRVLDLCEEHTREGHPIGIGAFKDTGEVLVFYDEIRSPEFIRHASGLRGREIVATPTDYRKECITGIFPSAIMWRMTNLHRIKRVQVVIETLRKLASSPALKGKKLLF